MSSRLRKTTLWEMTQENLSLGVFEQHRCRPACPSSHSDQHLYYSLTSLPRLATCEISVFLLVSVAEQESPKTDFLVLRAI